MKVSSPSRGFKVNQHLRTIGLKDPGAVRITLLKKKATSNLADTSNTIHYLLRARYKHTWSAPVFARHGNDKHGVIDIQVRLFFLRVNRRRGSFSASFRFPDLRNGLGTWTTFATRQWTLDGLGPTSAGLITGRRTTLVSWGRGKQRARRRRESRPLERSAAGSAAGAGLGRRRPRLRAARSPPPIDVIFILD